MIRNPETNQPITLKLPKKTKPKEAIVHTSVSLRESHKQILFETAKKYNLNPNDLIILLLRYSCKHHIASAKENDTIVYQPPTKDIKIINLYLSQRDYERNIDSRRFCKFGVSYMLAYAIIHFLIEVVHQIVSQIREGKIEILNNYCMPQTFIIKKRLNRIIFRSAWYPFRE